MIRVRDRELDEGEDDVERGLGLRGEGGACLRDGGDILEESLDEDVESVEERNFDFEEEALPFVQLTRLRLSGSARESAEPAVGLREGGEASVICRRERADERFVARKNACDG